MADTPPKRVSKARPMVGVRLAATQIEAIDAAARRRNMSRAVWLRTAIARVLTAEQAKGDQPGEPGKGGGPE